MLGGKKDSQENPINPSQETASDKADDLPF